MSAESRFQSRGPSQPVPLQPKARAKVATVTTSIVAAGGDGFVKTSAGAATIKVLEQAAPRVGRSVASGGAKAAARWMPWVGLAELGVRQAGTLRALQRGAIDRREYRRRTGGNLGSVSGGMGGAAAGAAIGSAVLPGVGTLFGGVLGGIAGSMGGEQAGRRAGGRLNR